MENYREILDYVEKNPISAVSLDLWNTLLFDDSEIDKNTFLKVFFKELSNVNWSKELIKYHHYFKKMERTGKVISLEFKINFILMKRRKTLKDLTFNYGKIAERNNYRVNKKLENLLIELKKRGIKLVIISNTGSIPAFSTKKILQNLKLDIFDYIFLSSEHGIGKPNPKAFEKTASKIGIPLDSFIHIGDSNEFDFVGGEASGVRKTFII
ncbi:2-haloalkanoic acid dehalogenase-related protein [Lactococcus lactis subsp. lactis]|uniref:HAD family hydrolase n=1 Tax=Lactococcus lactis TaxID=1358 RepID=UPI00071DD78E|nr:HAD family hydrolase [Lactococcus lactis]KST91475.1 2-haloalkanoic acid dehalogenase-related protein [Lactococcus lactis subsp. lactis]